MNELSEAVQRVNERFRPRQPEGRNLVRNVIVIHGQNPDAFENAPDVARVVADLLSAEVRDAPLDEFRNAWREEIGELADVISIKFTEPAIGPGGRAIDLRLLGYDLERLKAASGELPVWSNGYAGVLDLSDDLRPGKREYRLYLKPGAGVLGLDARAVADQVRGAFQGIKVDEFPVGPETYEVNLRLVAASLAFGLVAATAAALFLVPAVYCILDDFGLLGALHGEDEEGETEGVPAG